MIKLIMKHDDYCWLLNSTSMQTHSKQVS
jgi:hypothetical protein